MIQTLTIGAGGLLEFHEPGDFFRYLEGSAALTVTYYRGGAEVSRAEGIQPGYAEQFKVGEFDKLTVYSATAQTIQFVSRYGAVVSYDKAPNGTVTLTGQQGPFTNAQKTVTNASAQMLAANIARRYLLIQNNDAAGDIYVRLDGGVATIGTGIKIMAGGALELQGYVPTDEIVAIGSIASNANIVTVEG